MSNMARNKGQRGEREVVKLLQPVVNKVYKNFDLEPPEMKRNLMQSREGGYDLVGLDWLALEVKFQENEQINSWWQQTLRQTSASQIPVLFYRRARQPWRVKTVLNARSISYSLPVPAIISLDDFLSILELRLIEELNSSIGSSRDD